MHNAGLAVGSVLARDQPLVALAEIASSGTVSYRAPEAPP